jgi:hypothetical protein
MPLRDRSLPHQIVIFYYHEPLGPARLIAVSCNCMEPKNGGKRLHDPFAYGGILTAAQALAAYDEHLSSLPQEEEDHDASVASLE